MRPVGFLAGLVVASACGRIGFDEVDPTLVLWLPFDDAPQDGAENRAHGGQPGTCDGACPVLGTGVVGGAYVFESTSAIVVPDRPALHVAEGTAAVWVRLDALPVAGDFTALFMRPFADDSRNTWELFLYGGPPTRLLVGGTSGDAQLYTGIDWTVTGAWTHVAARWYDDIVELYVDGALRAEATRFVTQYDDHGVVLGADLDRGKMENHLRGALDDARLYSRPLSVDEIVELAQRR